MSDCWCGNYHCPRDCGPDPEVKVKRKLPVKVDLREELQMPEVVDDGELGASSASAISVTIYAGVKKVAK